MSQHWENEEGNGYFLKFKADELESKWFNGTINLNTIDVMDFQVPNCCQNIQDTRKSSDWRNSMVSEKIKSLNLQNKIHLLPFADATKATSDMHICHPNFKHDCKLYLYF
jgi:hypothetical protein